MPGILRQRERQEAENDQLLQTFGKYCFITQVLQLLTPVELI